MNRRAFIAVMGGAVVAMSVGERAYGSLLGRTPFYRKPGPGAKINGAHPLAFGMMGCWLLNEGSGARLTSDATGNPFTVGVGGPLGKVDAFGTGAPFGQWDNNGLITIPHHPRIDNLFNTANQKATMLAWVQSANASSEMVNKGNGGNAGWDFIKLNSTTVQWRQVPSGAFMTLDINGMSLAQFHQVAIVCNVGQSVTASDFTTYRDGVKVTPAATANGSGSISTDAAINLLLTSQGGNLDHVILWNRALSGSEVAELYDDPMCFMAPANNRALLVGSGTASGIISRRGVAF